VAQNASAGEALASKMLQRCTQSLDPTTGDVATGLYVSERIKVDDTCYLSMSLDREKYTAAVTVACIHTLALRNSEGTQRYLVEHRAKLCLLGLRELQRTWEVKNWILQLFSQYLDQSTAARLEIGEETGEPDAAPRQTSNSRGATANVEGDSLEDVHNTTLHSTDLSPGFEMPWLRSTEDVGQFLYSQIENKFVNDEGGALDWYMADLINTALPV
jgi:hypothetical protein